MKCDELRSLLERDAVCQETEYGTRIVTHCLYPSFDQVSVFISRWGEGFRITDGGGAVRSAMMHGRDDAALQSAFKKARARYSVASRNGLMIFEAESQEWLYSAILAVANASAMAASLAADHVLAAIERDLRTRIYEELRKVVPERNIATEYEYTGSSGKTWPVDYAVVAGTRLLIKAINPHPISISANYTAFGDIGANDNIPRFSVFDPLRPLKQEDGALMRQVAELVPLPSLEPGARRELQRAIT